MKIHRIFSVTFFVWCCASAIFLTGADGVPYKITVRGDHFTSKVLAEFSKQYQYYYTTYRPAGHLPENLQVQHIDQNNNTTTWILQEQRHICTSPSPASIAPNKLPHDFLTTFASVHSQDKQEKLVWAYSVHPTMPNTPQTVKEDHFKEKVSLPNGSEFKEKGFFGKYKQIKCTERNQRNYIPQKSWYNWWKKVEIFDSSTMYQENYTQNNFNFGEGTLHKTCQTSAPEKENVKIENYKRTTLAKTVIFGGLVATAAAAWKCYTWMTDQK